MKNFKSILLMLLLLFFEICIDTQISCSQDKHLREFHQENFTFMTL